MRNKSCGNGSKNCVAYRNAMRNGIAIGNPSIKLIFFKSLRLVKYFVLRFFIIQKVYSRGLCEYQPTLTVLRFQGRIWGVPRRRRNPLGSNGDSWNPQWIWSVRIFKMLILSNEVALAFFTFLGVLHLFSKIQLFGFGWGIYKE